MFPGACLLDKLLSPLGAGPSRVTVPTEDCVWLPRAMLGFCVGPEEPSSLFSQSTETQIIVVKVKGSECYMPDTILTPCMCRLPTLEVSGGVFLLLEEIERNRDTESPI